MARQATQAALPAGRQVRYAYEPDYAVLPGETLLETIEALGIDQKELARRTGFTEKHISHVITGKASITADAAIRLERVTGVPARFWNNLEAEYQEQRARLAAKEQLQADLEWLKRFPVNELVKRGVIPALRDPTEKLEAVLRFFGVASVAAWEEGWSSTQFAFRKSTAVAEKVEAVATWLRLAELQAAKCECAPYDARRFQASLKEIRGLTLSVPSEFQPRMIDLCAEAGVALVFVPEIKGPVSGASKWLTPTKPMIAINLRGKANDKFWFTFFHEAGHVLHDGKREVFVDVAYSDDPCEQRANHFAGEFLIPAQYESELARLQDRMSVRTFAHRLGIHPAIVVGRLQHDKVIPFNHMNDLKVKLQWSKA